MKPYALVAVLLLARALALAGHEFSVSPWSIPAFLCQDLLVVVLFAGVDRAIKRAWLSWLLYGLIVAYAAVNLPVQRALSSPLTWTMLRAAGRPLADSVRHYATWQNGGIMAVLVAAGLIFPFCLLRLRRLAPEDALRSRRHQLWYLLLGGALIALDQAANARFDTRGLHRNALVTLVTSVIPHVRAQAADRDWSRSAFNSGPVEDLSAWRRSCAGRNVILILLESTGAQYLQAFGGTADPTPCLSALARDALVFENAYCVYPESIKGLFSVLCSQYPAFDSEPGRYADVQIPSLAHTLTRHGYRSGLFHSGRFMYLGMESIVRNRGYEVLADAGDIGGNHESSFGIEETATVERILAWIDSLAENKFFVTYLPIAGHHPYASPETGPFPETTELGRYFNALHYGDAALNRLLAGLRERGVLENTLLVLCGDHGEAFGQHDSNYGHTMFLYEENVHVPLSLVAPHLFKSQTRVKRIVSLIDAAPTILDLVGIETPASWQGRSLLTGRNEMALFYADYALGWVGLRDGPFKFMHELSSGRSSLYDLERDPGERIDLSIQFPSRMEVYRRHLLDWSAAQKARIQSSAKDCP